jgi:UDP-N-acetylmuramyl tripeptide synthase
MGEVAAEYADMVYLTDDETYLEDPAKIRKEVEKVILKAGGKAKYIEIGDRRKAIKQAFKDAQKGDVVVLCGIGHQDYRAMGVKKEPWDERQVAKEILGEL